MRPHRLSPPVLLTRLPSATPPRWCAASAASASRSTAGYVCAECFGPLEVAYDLAGAAPGDHRVRPAVDVALRRAAAGRPRRSSTAAGCSPAGRTLVRADQLARELGVRRLWVKDDSANPTHSFKDRVVAVALEAAARLGYQTIACASTGNLANAVAAAAARARAALGGVRAVRPRGRQDRDDRGVRRHAGGHRRQLRRRQPAVLGGRPPSGTGASSTSTCGRTTPRAPRRSATRSPSSSAGALPDAVVSPVASGSLLTKVDKAFRELAALGLVEPTPYQVFGAQATGCSPVSAGVPGRAGRRPPGQAGHDREVAGHREPGRRPLRPRRRPAHRRRHR